MALPDDPDSALESQATPDDKLKKVHERALRRFDIAVLPQLEQRSLALAARRFVAIPGAMWEGEFGESFCNAIKMEINLTKDGLEKIYRDYNENRIVPDFRPAGGKGDDESANTLDGLHRADSHFFSAQEARDNAALEAFAGGFGAYRLTNEWADPYDKESDYQRINPALLIADADQRVFFDPDETTYAKRKARYAFVITAKDRKTAEEEYEDYAVSWPEVTIDAQYDWFTPDVIRIAEYYEVEEVDAKLYILKQKLSGEERRLWDSELEPGELANLRKMGWKVSTRTVQRRRVHKYILSGSEVLEDKGLIAGDRIPIVPMYGKRSYVDGVERFKGYVQDKMDQNRLFNAVMSRLAETSSQSPREIPIFAAEQMPPHIADMWKNQVVDRHAYALVEPLRGEDGQVIAAGPIGKVEAPNVSSVDATIIQVLQATLTDDQQDGSDEVKANTSADALEVAATRVDAKSGIYLDNARQSTQCEGEIYLSMAADVYHEPGREVETMDEDGNDGTAVLSQQTVDKSGVARISNNFTPGHYKVVADVTEATATRRDKTVKSCMAIAEVATAAQNLPLANVAMLVAVKNMDGEGMSEMQDYAHIQLVQLGVDQPTDEEKAQMAQAQGQQQPDAEQQLAAAATAEKAASAQLKAAQAGAAKADTVLKLAQASAIGGPEQAPAVPTGLEAAHKLAEIGKTTAEARQIEMATSHMPTKLHIEATNATANQLKAQASAHSAKFGAIAKLFPPKKKSE